MKKAKINNLDLDVYEETLENGLRIFIVPNKTVKNVYMTFTTKYGSVDSEFVPIDGKKMIKVSDGIAHFLEHKLFEQEKGDAPFEFFAKTGTDVNANTSAYKTTYLFVGQKNINNNIKYLLDFVQSPYFTDENVEKEKGIIEQEIRMYEDNPEACAYEKSLANSFVEHPIRVSVAGTVNSIKKITKEELYKCYKSFYHPNNMFVVITGNINPENAIKIIKENQANKKFDTFKEIKRKEYKEPITVKHKTSTIYKNVTIPRLVLSYKFDLHKFKMDVEKVKNYITFYMRIKFGQVSEFYEELTKKELVSSEIEFTTVRTDDHILLMVDTSTKYPEKLNKILSEEIVKMNITEDEFLREKKVAIASQIYMSDSIYRINEFIISCIIAEDKIDYNRYNNIKKLNYKEFESFTSKLDFSNKSVLYIKKDK